VFEIGSTMYSTPVESHKQYSGSRFATKADGHVDCLTGYEATHSSVAF